jgi:hypothetical protein
VFSSACWDLLNACQICSMECSLAKGEEAPTCILLVWAWVDTTVRHCWCSWFLLYFLPTTRMVIFLNLFTNLPGYARIVDIYWHLSYLSRLWKGFLGSKLSSLELIWFALATFMVAPNSLRYRLVRHLMVDPSGASLLRTYTGLGAESSRRLELNPVGNQVAS